MRRPRLLASGQGGFQGSSLQTKKRAVSCSKLLVLLVLCAASYSFNIEKGRKAFAFLAAILTFFSVLFPFLFPFPIFTFLLFPSTSLPFLQPFFLSPRSPSRSFSFLTFFFFWRPPKPRSARPARPHPFPRPSPPPRGQKKALRARLFFLLSCARAFFVTKRKKRKEKKTGKGEKEKKKKKKKGNKPEARHLFQKSATLFPKKKISFPFLQIPPSRGP